MGRCTVLQNVKQEAELGTGFFRTDLESVEYLALNISLVDTDGAARRFPSR